ncbi:MAG: hypothetical protein PWQ32_286 [Thermococcaceae archaeon]|nr:hypothetical protein [Thermococcaceae archaeon]
MRKILPILFIGLLVFATGCTQTSTTTSTTAQEGLDFSSYSRGEIIQKWWEMFSAETVYVSKGYEELAKYYFPNAQIKTKEEFESGIAILAPEDARELLRGKPILTTPREYFGYVLYKSGIKFVGEEMGTIIAYKENGNARLIFTGNGKSGIGAALELAKELKEGRTLNPSLVLRREDFEGIVLKVIGDNDWDGIKDEDEYWVLKEVYVDEPFIYNWRVVKGENITVSGGFIRLVNGSKVYIRALGFNVSVKVKDPKGVQITYVIENINPQFVEYPNGAKVGETWIEVTTREDFSIAPREVKDFNFLAFGDNRPGSGTKQPEAFFKIRDLMNEDTGAFIIDSGDLVYSGKVEEWAELLKEWKFNKPVFVAPGNHEYRGEGKNVYHKFFGPTDYSFVLGGYYFIFANNVENNYKLTSAQWAWLEEELKKAKALGKRPVIVMHTPPLDPRPEGDHAMDPTDARKLLELMKEYNAFGVFGHIHIYWYGEKDGVEMVITGGGGAPPYAKPDEGGFYHYVRINAGDTIAVEPVKVE